MKSAVPILSLTNANQKYRKNLIAYTFLASLSDYNIVSCTQLYYGLYCSAGTCPWGSTLYCGYAMV